MAVGTSSGPTFRDRAAAGLALVRTLGARPGPPLVVAASRSGVPVAQVVARALGSTLHVLPIGRVQIPGCAQPIGAVDEDGCCCITAPDLHAVTPSLVDHEVRAAKADLERLRCACGLGASRGRGAR